MHRFGVQNSGFAAQVRRGGCRFLVGAVAIAVLVAGCQRPIAPPPIPQPPRPVSVAGKTVVIDAGHGGRDPGAPGVGPVAEKHVNLAIAMRLAQMLRQRGITVISTRRDDTFVPLDERAATADRYSADLLVSIHADAAPNPNATGTTIYVANGALDASEIAASRIEASLSAAGIKSRGVRRAKFRVLVGHTRPSVLVECGYLTNAVEASRLASPGYQALVAGAIATGVLDHLRATR